MKLRATARVVWFAVASAAMPCGVTAQSSRGRLAAVYALDSWLVTRYRDAQLLPDSAKAFRSLAADAPMPHIESVSDAPTRDTLFAVHFGTRRDISALRSGARVRLTAPSGAITSVTADIIARRPFRAPKVPGAASNVESAWRYGWAYAVLVSRGARSTTGAIYRGWMLLDAPDASLRR